LRFETTETVQSADTEHVLSALESALGEISGRYERVNNQITLHGLGPSPRARNPRDTTVFTVYPAGSSDTAIQANVTFQASALLGAYGQDSAVRSKLDYVFEQVRQRLHTSVPSAPPPHPFAHPYAPDHEIFEHAIQHTILKDAKLTPEPAAPAEYEPEALAEPEPVLARGPWIEPEVPYSPGEPPPVPQPQFDPGEIFISDPQVVVPPAVSRDRYIYIPIPPVEAAAEIPEAAARPTVASIEEAAEAHASTAEVVTELPMPTGSAWRHAAKAIRTSDAVEPVQAQPAPAAAEQVVPAAIAAPEWKQEEKHAVAAALANEELIDIEPPAFENGLGKTSPNTRVMIVVMMTLLLAVLSFYSIPWSSHRSGWMSSLARWLSVSASTVSKPSAARAVPLSHTEPDPTAWLNQWSDAMRSGDPVLLASFYADPVQHYLDHANMSKEALIANLRDAIESRSDFFWTVRLEDMRVEPQSHLYVTATFMKHFVQIGGSANSRQSADFFVPSRIEMRRIAGEWKIVSEQGQDTAPNSATNIESSR